MEKVVSFKGSVVVLLAMVIQSFLLGACSLQTSSFSNGVMSNWSNVEAKTYPGVKLYTRQQEVVMSNGLVEVTLSAPEGEVTGIKYGGMPNVLDIKNLKDRRGYWDIVWNKREDSSGIFAKLRGTMFKVVTQNKEQVEVSFRSRWKVSSPDSASTVPLNIDIRYIMLRGVSGFYFYAILERKQGWPDVYMDHIRAVFKLRQDKFRYMALSDEVQKLMPLPEDRERGQTLAYREAVLLTDPSDSRLKGEVDDKYQYSKEHKDNRLHGWISHNPRVGFWMITPSDEFRSCGPVKQDLTSHVGPAVLSIFSSTHYGGREIDTLHTKEKAWKKVLGPAFVFLNSVPANRDPHILWENAKHQMLKEVSSWPYDFAQSKDFPKSNQRGRVAGRLQVLDLYMNKNLTHAKSAYVGLAAPGDAGSWQRETKGYQFWVQTDEKGRFVIRNVREGHYNLYAWVPGFVGDYKYAPIVSVKPGSKTYLGDLVYEPPRNGPTLWEIGVPDRSAAEFFVPDPPLNLRNPVFTRRYDRFRQYGLWDRYADYYPNNDLKYTVGVSNFARDWFFAHVTGKGKDSKFVPTTRQIIFQMENVQKNENYTLQLAVAAAMYSNLQVRFNHQWKRRPLFSTGTIGRDNAIARHGSHGLYRFYSIKVPGILLFEGKNILYLTQSRSVGPFQGLMYDYIRFEGLPSDQAM